MLTLASITALVLAISPGGIAGSPGLLVPGGVGCEGDTNLTLEADSGGRTYMSGSGKMICADQGPGTVTGVLYKNGTEMARKTIDTLETSAIAAVAVPCSNGPEEVTWIMVAQYLDDRIGMTIQHRIVENNCG